MKNQTLIEQSLEILKNNGFKYTKKREALLTYLVKRNRYVSAKEVFDFMNEEFKGVSYDTIYRNLHDFSELDLLEETDLNGEMKSICVQWTILKINYQVVRSKGIGLKFSVDVKTVSSCFIIK